MSKIQYGKRPLYAPKKIYFIGDVHNEAEKLTSILEQIEPKLTEEDHVVFTGDLVDRGDDAATTIDVLVAFIMRHYKQVFFVQGNHDWMLQHYLTTGSHDWTTFLSRTLKSWQETWHLPDIAPDTMVVELIQHGFYEITSRTIPYYETENVIATHAPFDLATVLCHGGGQYQQDYLAREQNPAFTYLLERMLYDLKWGFTDETTDIPVIDKFRVCGHQAAKSKHPRLFTYKAFIDTGCGLKRGNPLTCVVYPGKRYFQSR